MELPEFKSFRKIHRWNRDVIVTEKLDGTNGLVWISDDGREIAAGSRNRWLTLDDDNYGFASWVETNRLDLLKLGPGSHHGEWWGSGIQRKYGLTEKRFSLFNVSLTEIPTCCELVPTLWTGTMEQLEVPAIMNRLKILGSVAVPGFMNPEGIVIYHVASNAIFKKTFEKEEGKTL